MPTVVGVDLAAGRGVSAVAALRLRAGALPAFEPTATAVLATDAEIVAAVVSVRPSVVAIDAPLTLPRAVTAALLGSLPVASAESAGALQSSPYTRAAERDPLWSRLGVRPLPVSFLGGLAFRAIALLPRLRAALPAAAIVEAFPSAALAALGITRFHSANGPRQRKTTPAARLAVQHALAGFIAGLPALEAEPLGADTLDALAAALTAAAYASGDVFLAGDAAEGQIVVPRPR